MRFLARALSLGLLLPAVAHAEATEVFEKFAERVVQVRVLEQGSGSKSVIGSGFFVSADGTVVTNYHVVSSLVFQPTDYRLEVLDSAGKTVAAKVLDVDVVHDLAILKAETSPVSAFTLEPIEPVRGARLYSLGNPHDVGFSILEGTYNGLIAESLYEHVHFSGSLNGGVSGGPTLDERGRVVGVNVSSYGNQLSFLVPVKFARELLDRVAAAQPSKERPLLDRVRESLLANQERVSRLLLDGNMPRTRLGGWELPGRWLPQLREWADRSKDNEPLRRYRWTSYGARSEDGVYLTAGENTGTVGLSHMLFERDGAGRTQLFRQAGQTFMSTSTLSMGDEDSSPGTTRWKCRDALVNQGGTRLKTIICLRAYKQLEGLYEALVRYLALDDPDRTVVGELTLTGFSVVNVEAISRRFLGAVTWKP